MAVEVSDKGRTTFGIAADGDERARGWRERRRAWYQAGRGTDRAEPRPLGGPITIPAMREVREMRDAGGPAPAGTRQDAVFAQTNGLVVFGGAVIATLCVAWPPSRFEYRAGQARVYGLETWWMLGLFLVAGLAMSPPPGAVRRVAASVAGCCGAVAIGTGLVAQRRWFTAGGFNTHATNEAGLRVLAVVLAMAGAVVVGTVAIDLARSATRWDALRLDAWLLVLLGAGVAVVVPLAMGWHGGNGTTQVGAHALMYGLPWGGAIAASALFDRLARRAIAGAVAATAAPLLLTEAMIDTLHTEVGALLAILAAATAVVVDLVVRPSGTVELGGAAA